MNKQELRKENVNNSLESTINTQRLTQRQESAVDKLLESMKNAYLDDDSVKMQDISKTILKLHYQNEIFIMKNPQLELRKVKQENMQLIDIYSNILVLQVRMHNKELERKGSN